MISELESFYFNFPEPTRSSFLALREYILNKDDNFADAWKYRLGFIYYKKKAFCYFWKDKITGQPYIGFNRSQNIDHPMLILGNRKKIKVMYFDPSKDLPIKELDIIIRALMKNY